MAPPERPTHLRALPPVEDSRGALDDYRRQIREAVANPPAPRERWLRRIIRTVKSAWTAAR